MSESASNKMSFKSMVPRFAILLAVAALVGFGGPMIGMNPNQSTACAVFISIIFGTLFFWEMIVMSTLSSPWELAMTGISALKL